MGLYPPCFTTTTLASLDAVGIAILYEGEGWFITSYQHKAGPYNTLEAALEASVSWVSASNSRQGGETPQSSSLSVDRA